MVGGGDRGAEAAVAARGRSGEIVREDEGIRPGWLRRDEGSPLRTRVQRKLSRSQRGAKELVQFARYLRKKDRTRKNRKNERDRGLGIVHCIFLRWSAEYN